MNRRSLLLTLIFAVPLAALIAWWLHEFEYVSIEVDQPLRGEARYNPLYALKKTLQAQSIEVAAGGDAGFDVDALAVGDALARLLAHGPCCHGTAWIEGRRSRRR